MALTFEYIAMGLDTLPVYGRAMLFAYLLSVALAGIAWWLRSQPNENMQLLYRKGSLLALVLLPALLWLMDVQMPVHVEVVREFNSELPGWGALAVLGVWMAGTLPGLWKLRRAARMTHQAVGALPVVGEDAGRKLAGRVAHWQQRLSLDGEHTVALAGGSQAWHAGRVLALPSASLNWPAGLVDAAVLLQLAQRKQGCRRWLVFAHLVRILYWPAPWVGRLAVELVALLPRPAARLARAAYRDPDGWRRDVRNLAKRYEMLESPDTRLLVVSTELEVAELPQEAWGGDVPRRHAGTWKDTKLRRAMRHFDPYERAYWLIAVAALGAGLATTLTVVRQPPEFEPQYLQVKWQDQMGRRLHDQPDDRPPPVAGKLRVRSEPAAADAGEGG